jgi:hypothetical protein
MGRALHTSSSLTDHLQLSLYLLLIPFTVAQTDSDLNGTVIDPESDNDTYTMPFPHFREIASSFAKSGMHSTPKEQQPLNNTTEQRPESRFTTEGVRLARSFWEYFWNPKHSHFTTKVPSAETVLLANIELSYRLLIDIL